MMWDLETGERVKKMSGHTNIVNSIQPARAGSPLLVTGSDDCTLKVSPPFHSFLY
jgi:Prp8 binding protein